MQKTEYVEKINWYPPKIKSLVLCIKMLQRSSGRTIGEFSTN